jgi:recombinational DNA repair ATPase RecF
MVALRKRNALLEEDMDIETRRQQLQFWNEYLIERASIITTARKAYIDTLNNSSHFAHRWFKIIYHANTMTTARFAEKQDTEIAARRTLIGPQKDDIEILISSQDSVTMDPTSFRNVQHFGSRSQQRLALLWLKIREIEHLEATFQMKAFVFLVVFYEVAPRNIWDAGTICTEDGIFLTRTVILMPFLKFSIYLFVLG